MAQCSQGFSPLCLFGHWREKNPRSEGGDQGYNLVSTTKEPRVTITATEMKDTIRSFLGQKSPKSLFLKVFSFRELLQFQGFSGGRGHGHAAYGVAMLGLRSVLHGHPNSGYVFSAPLSCGKSLWFPGELTAPNGQALMSRRPCKGAKGSAVRRRWRRQVAKHVQQGDDHAARLPRAPRSLHSRWL